MTGTAATRRRLTWSLFGVVAVGTTGFFASVSTAPLLAEELVGPTWSGLPSTVSILGTAAGAALLSRLMARRGRRRGLVAGYVIGAVGAVGVIAAAQTSLFVLMVVASAGVGFSQAANQLSRYAAADVQPGSRRGAGLGLVVWAGTVGAVAGPNLLAASGSVARRLGGSVLSGPYGLTALAVLVAGLAAAVLLRPDPSELSDEAAADESPRDRDRTDVRTAVAALTTGQVVMVLIMTMTPVHIRHVGGSLGVVGGVMSAHIIGMYAFTPVVGWVSDRVGHHRTVVASLAVLAAAGVGVASLGGSGAGLGLPLFVLGLGWSGTFVSGSTLLTGGVAYDRRARLQGRVDAVAWTCAAVASLVSGVILSVAGYEIIGVTGTALAVAAAVVVLLRLQPSRPASQAA